MSEDPYAPLKENAWREAAQIHVRLERGEIDEEGWRTTEDALASWGFVVQGRSVRANRHKPGMEYRVLWIDR